MVGGDPSVLELLELAESIERFLETDRHWFVAVEDDGTVHRFPRAHARELLERARAAVAERVN